MRYVRKELLAGALALLVGACGIEPGSGQDATGSPPAAPRGVHKTAAAAPSLIRLAEATRAAGDRVYARSLYLRASTTAPDSLEVQIKVGEALFQMGDHRTAEAAFRRALSIDPVNPMALRGRGMALVALNMPHHAIDDLEAATAAGADYRAYNALGIAYDMLENRQTAQKAYRQGLAANPDNATLRTNLALSLALSGQGEAAKTLLKPLETNPDTEEHHRQNIALAYEIADTQARTNASGAALDVAALRDSLNMRARHADRPVSDVAGPAKSAADAPADVEGVNIVPAPRVEVVEVTPALVDVRTTLTGPDITVAHNEPVDHSDKADSPYISADNFAQYLVQYPESPNGDVAMIAQGRLSPEGDDSVFDRVAAATQPTSAAPAGAGDVLAAPGTPAASSPIVQSADAAGSIGLSLRHHVQATLEAPVPADGTAPRVGDTMAESPRSHLPAPTGSMASDAPDAPDTLNSGASDIPEQTVQNMPIGAEAFVEPDGLVGLQNIYDNPVGDNESIDVTVDNRVEAAPDVVVGAAPTVDDGTPVHWKLYYVKFEGAPEAFEETVTHAREKAAPAPLVNLASLMTDAAATHGIAPGGPASRWPDLAVLSMASEWISIRGGVKLFGLFNQFAEESPWGRRVQRATGLDNDRAVPSRGYDTSPGGEKLKTDRGILDAMIDVLSNSMTLFSGLFAFHVQSYMDVDD